MANKWFRFYTTAMRNPKVAKLSDKDFRLWVELLSVASENDGLIPCLEDLKHLLRRRLDHLKRGVDRLLSASLIDALDDGYKPHDWEEYQYKSDTSTERVNRFRKKRNVSVTPPDTDTDTDTEIKDTSYPKRFDEFWDAFADKRGLAEAKKAWHKINPDSALADKIISGARKYAEWRETAKPKDQTGKMAQGWLSGERWKDVIELQAPKLAESASAWGKGQRHVF